MSWKRSGTLLQGPPSASPSYSSQPAIAQKYRPNPRGISAFERERQLAPYASPSSYALPRGRTEWDVLRENHRFIRDDEEVGDVSWEERLARAYESKLFKEFALVDLKHYKSKRFALRWRTAPEVIQGLGEETCASLRCRYHSPASVAARSPERITFELPQDTPSARSERGETRQRSGREEKNKRGERSRLHRRKDVQLRSFELPFVYEEKGERKEAMVKVRLCRRCEAKLVWKPGNEDIGGDGDQDGEEDVRSMIGERVGGRDGRGEQERGSRIEVPQREEARRRGEAEGDDGFGEKLGRYDRASEEDMQEGRMRRKLWGIEDGRHRQRSRSMSPVTRHRLDERHMR